MEKMEKTYLKALLERGHNPNLIIMTQPAKRDGYLMEPTKFNDSQPNNHLSEPILQHSISTQQMPLRGPLRMLVSQKAERTLYKGNGPFKYKGSENIQHLVPPCDMANGISSYLKTSKRKSHNFANASVRMLLQNPYVTKFRSENSQSHKCGKTSDENPFKFHNKNTDYSMMEKENLCKDSFFDENYSSSQIIKEKVESVTDCTNKYNLELLQCQAQTKIKQFDYEVKTREESIFFKQPNMETSPMYKIDNEKSTDANHSPLSILSFSEKNHSFDFEESDPFGFEESDSFDFIWTPVQCSNSNNECNFQEQKELEEKFSFSFSNCNSP